MADAGVAARRVCERMIEQGRVTVNGKVVTKLPVFVNPHEDDIRVEGRRIAKPDRMLYIMLNKPEQTLVSASDEPGFDRRTVLQLVNHPAAARLYPVGRLDFDTTGLVILTNDGDLTHKLTHPKYGVVKTYHAVVRGVVSDEHLEAIGQKLRSEHRREVRLSPEEAAKRDKVGEPKQQIRALKRDAGRTLLEISLKEAKNRQIREVLGMLGCPVKKLTRVALGPVVLTAVAAGQWRELTRDEVHMLREATSARAGARKAPQQSPKNKSMNRSGSRKPGTKPAPKPEPAPEQAPAPRVVEKPAPTPVARPAKARGPRVIKP